jgi:hypothetical protein
MKIYNSSPSNDFEDMYAPSSEPTTCDCENQLGHFDWNGLPLENLPDLCKQTMGIRAGNMPISPRNGK